MGMMSELEARCKRLNAIVMKPPYLAKTTSEYYRAVVLRVYCTDHVVEGWFYDTKPKMNGTYRGWRKS